MATDVVSLCLCVSVAIAYCHRLLLLPIAIAYCCCLLFFCIFPVRSRLQVIWCFHAQVLKCHQNCRGPQLSDPRGPRLSTRRLMGTSRRLDPSGSQGSPPRLSAMSRLLQEPHCAAGPLPKPFWFFGRPLGSCNMLSLHGLHRGGCTCAHQEQHARECT